MVILCARVFNLQKCFVSFALFLFFRFRLRCSPRSDLLALVANEKLKLIEHFYREANVCMGLRKQQRQTSQNTNNNKNSSSNSNSDVSAHKYERAIFAWRSRSRCRCHCRCRRWRCRCASPSLSTLLCKLCYLLSSHSGTDRNVCFHNFETVWNIFY